MAVTILATATLVACATISQPADTRVDEGVKDFIEIEDLAEIDAIRTRHDLRLHDLSTRYVLAADIRGEYLVAYRGTCRRLPHDGVRPDYRQEVNTIRAGSDSLRGCHIGSIYKVSPAQADELKQIGEIANQ